jgi:NhaP-type Na+/H+ or K+/H+ antiporter
VRAVFGSAGFEVQTLVAAALWTIVGSIAFGSIIGALFGLYFRYVGRELTVVLLALAAVAAGVGGGLQFEPLLSGLAAGLVVRTALGPTGDVLRGVVARGVTPVLVFFFATLGASMHVEAVASVGLAALALAALRITFLRAGVQIGSRVAGLDGADTPLIWRALMSTADVTLVLTVLLASEYGDWGARLQTMVAVVAPTSSRARSCSAPRWSSGGNPGA